MASYTMPTRLQVPLIKPLCRNLGSMSTLVKIDKSFGMLNLLIQVRFLLPRDPHHLHATYNCPKGPNSPDNLVIFQRNVIFLKIAARNWQCKLLDAKWHLDRDLEMPVFAEDLDSHGKCYYCCNYQTFIWGVTRASRTVTFVATEGLNHVLKLQGTP